MDNRCQGNCDGKNPAQVYEFAPGVCTYLCEADQGQFCADLMAVMKSYGFIADEDAAELYDDIKNIG